MDPAIVRAAGTLTLFVSFLALCAWAWAPSQKRRFEEAAHLPFLDEEQPSAGDGRRKA